MKDPARQRRERGKAMDQLVPLDEECQGEPRGDDISDDREGQQSLVHGSKNSSVARVYHIPDVDSPGVGAPEPPVFYGDSWAFQTDPSRCPRFSWSDADQA